MTSRKLINISKRSFATHEVFNQPKPFLNIHLTQSDPTLRDGIKSMLGNRQFDWDHLNSFGAKSGTAEMFDHADKAEKNRPVLRQFDNYGRRVDVVDYHDSYHTLMKHGLENGAAGYGFKHATPGSQLMRASLIYLENQVEAGHCCPIVMTAAAIPCLQKVSHIPWIKIFIDKLLSLKYDPRNLPIEQKEGVVIGMSMTEKQGGSDVRSNTTMAKPIEAGKTGIGASYSLVGHKVKPKFISFSALYI